MINNLKQENQVALAVVIKAVDEFPWADHAAYAGWLAQTYHYAAHTVSLLSFMAARTNIKKEPELHKARIVHSSEEAGHDKWLLADLAALGHSIDEFPELPETRAFWEPQFAKPDLYNVESVYGYTIILEQVAVHRG